MAQPTVAMVTHSSNAISVIFRWLLLQVIIIIFFLIKTVGKKGPI